MTKKKDSEATGTSAPATTETPVLNLYQKLIEVRKVVEFLKKDAHSETGARFKYVSSSQAILAVRSKMDEMGLLLVPTMTSKKVSPHKTAGGKDWYFTEIDFKYTWVNADNPTEIIECDWYGQGLDEAEKGVGKACTYSEKFFLLKFFNVPTDKDDPDQGSPEDKGKQNGNKTKPPQSKRKRTQEQYIKEIQATKTEEEYRKYWKENVASMKADLSPEQQTIVTYEAKKHAAAIKPLLQSGPTKEPEQQELPSSPSSSGLTPYKCPGGPLDGEWTDTAYCRDTQKCPELGQCDAYQQAVEKEIT